jgi:SAM-dependent methyltransferase
MGDINQVHFLREKVPQCDGPILEVGSKDYGNTSSFRRFYSAGPYIGVDLQPGTGVDVVLDLTTGLGNLKENHFALVICCSVLEHVKKPWLMADNITRLLRPGGRLYVSVPWVWRYHPYPDDYFRFSFRGVRSLFEQFEWGPACYSTTAEGDFHAIDESQPGIDNAMAVVVKSESEQRRKYLPYLMVNMIGTKHQGAARRAA